MKKDIVIILPYKESLNPLFAGAVSLYVKDTTNYSKFKKRIKIISSDNYTSKNYLFNELNSICMYFMYRCGFQPFFNKVPSKYKSQYASNETKKRLKNINDKTINLYVPVKDMCPMVNDEILKCDN